uniref:Carbonic anhydrase n=1 Tax=Elaeophora elaphi TaxID=1147741 RepID=A0A158Q8E3_9BILA
MDIFLAANKFGYGEEDGPSTWRGVCQTGKRQSPVDIRAFEIEIAPLDPILFLNYELTGHIHLANNGHTGQQDNNVVIGSGFERWGNERPYISGGGLNGTYQLSQFHFHWSQRNDTGSEHTIASLHYPGELHLVHTKKDPAPDEVNTIAVIAAFIRLDDHAGSLGNLKPYIQNIKMPKTELVVPDFSVGSLLPEHKENFYRYEGSLTTPGCDEAVVWTLMADPITVTPSQMRAFHQVNFASGKTGHNWRPTQPLNGRKILFRPTVTTRSMNGVVSLKPTFELFISFYGMYHIISIFLI